MDSEDETLKADRLAARAARFNNKLVGNRYKELEQARSRERREYEAQGLISAGQTELEGAIDMRGTCERMCPEYEVEFREFTGEVHPLEARDDNRRRIDHNKAVAAYTRSDAGAGLGEAAKLPSDLRTPTALVKSLDYLFHEILPVQPNPPPARASPRTALGNTAGFIRDRTRAIRKEFAIQPSWGQAEAISSYERIARWHILCLRELQEETGMNADMHIDSAELGRCFTSLRQQYNDRREESGLDMPCPNEPEFRAYMLIYDLNQKAVAISTAEVPSTILDHPNVQIAWQLRRAAQRNFDSQKEGSKMNAELGANLITSFVKVMKQAGAPYLLSCLAEVRLREVRRSALRALQRTYPRLRDGQWLRYNAEGEVVERKMVLIPTLDNLLGCEAQETEEGAWDDVEPTSKNPDDEAAEVARRFQLRVIEENDGAPMGALVNQGALFDDNKDAPFTRRWQLITDKQGTASYEEIIDGLAGVIADPGMDTRVKASRPQLPTSKPAFPTLTKALSPSHPTAPPASRAPFSFTPHAPTAQPAPAVPTKPTFLQPPVGAASSGPPSASAPSTGSAGLAPVTLVTEAPKSATAQPLPSFFPPSTSSPPIAASSGTQANVPSQPSAPFSFNFAKPVDPALDSTAKILAPPTQPTSHTTQPSLFSFTTPASKPSEPATRISQEESLQHTPSDVFTPSRIPNLGLSSAEATGGPSSPRRLSPHQSLTLSTSRRIPSGSGREEKRREQRAIVPALTRALVNEVITSLLSEIEPDLVRTIKIQLAAREYADRKGKRRDLLRDWSVGLFDRLLEDVMRDATKEVFLSEIALRAKVRSSVSHWQEWAKEREEVREEAEKDREQIWERMQSMGLGGSSLGHGGLVPADSSDSVRMKADEVDVALQEAERMREQFNTPGSFLHSIARCLSPLIATRNSYFDQSGGQAQFTVVLSSSTDSANPPPPSASKWLRSKLRPSHVEDGWWNYRDVRYAFKEVARYDEVEKKGLDSLGLVVLEVPMSSGSARDEDENKTDVRERLMPFLKMLDNDRSAYNPPLMLLSWQDETQEEIVTRLDLADYTTAFSKVTAVSLFQADHLEERFVEGSQEIISDDIWRSQLVLHLDEAVPSLDGVWQHYLTASRFLLQRHPMAPALAGRALSAGIHTLSEIQTCIHRWANQRPTCETSTFEVVALPPMSMPDARDMSDVVTTIEEYLQQDQFSALDEVNLAGSMLRGAWSSEIALPIPDLLSAIAAYIFAELSTQVLAVRVYGTREYIKQMAIDFSAYLTSAASRIVDEQIDSITALSASLDPARLAGDDDTPPAMIQPSPPLSSHRSLKRPLNDTSTDTSPRSKGQESRGSKNARLVEAIRAVKKTLLDMEAEDTWSAGSVDVR